MAKEKKEPVKVILIVIVFSLILIISLGSAIFFYIKYKQALSIKSSFLEIDSIVKKVGLLMELPKNETPTLATVSDKTKLQNQEFFQNAENGDKVLIYNQAKKAILYRPSINKIIDIAPIRFPQTTPTTTVNAVISSLNPTKPPPTTTFTTSKKVRVVLYNGTSTVGITYKVEAELLPEIEDIEIVDRDKAAKSDYKKSIVVDLTNGKFKEKAAELATFLKGEVGILPDGEKKPDADILVILGQ